MYKVIRMDDCINGYNINHFDCIRLAIACMTSQFGQFTYQAYCAYESIFNNWEIEKVERNRNSILNKLGLSLEEVAVETCERFDCAVQDIIDEGCSLLFLPVYNTIFYSTSYKIKAITRHGTVICGYDDKRDLYIVRENVHVVEPSDIRTVTPFYKFHLKKELVWEMWEESRAQLSPEETLLYQMRKTQDIDKICDNICCTDKEFIGYLANIDPEKDGLLERLGRLNQVIEELSKSNAQEIVANRLLRLLSIQEKVSESQLTSIRNEIIQTNGDFRNSVINYL